MKISDLITYICISILTFAVCILDFCGYKISQNLYSFVITLQAIEAFFMTKLAIKLYREKKSSKNSEG